MSPDKRKKLNILRKKLDLLDNKLIKLIKIRTNIVKDVLKLKTYKHEIVDKKINCDDLLIGDKKLFLISRTICLMILLILLDINLKLIFMNLENI